MTEIQKQIRRTMGDYLWYIMVGFASVLALTFLPFLGTTVEMGWNWPATPAGWVVFIVTKLFVVGLNFIIFHSFIQQARINIRHDQNYLKALQILRAIDPKTKKPMSLRQFNRKQYGVKGVMTAITSLMSAFSLGQAILTFDWVMFLSYLFTIAVGVLFGILQMKKYESFYTQDYLIYALYYQDEYNKKLLKQETENDECSVPNLEQQNP